MFSALGLKIRYKYTKYLLSLLLIFVFALLATFSSDLSRTAYAATLLGASDYISDDTPLETNITHNVGFVIPSSGHAITPSDYIRVTLTDYSAVTAPTSGSGWTGSPTYSVNGNTALVTNVSAPTGSGIAVGGITATNPAPAGSFDVTIQIANDAVGTIVYDSVTVTAEVISSSPTVSLTIEDISSSLGFSGYTSPNAFVTIKMNGSTAATTTANANGDFNATIIGLTPDLDYSIEIYAQDTYSRRTKSVSFTVHTIGDTEVTTSDITLTSTHAVQSVIIDHNGTQRVMGLAHPYSSITIFIDDITRVVQANSSGSWHYDFCCALEGLSVGYHTVRVKEVAVGGHESETSNPIFFESRYSAGSTPPVEIPESGPGDDIGEDEVDDSDMIDRSQKLLNITKPQKGSRLKLGEPLVMQGETEPFAFVDIYLDGELIATVQADSEGNFLYIYYEPLSEGEHTLHFEVRDENGNTLDSLDDYIFTVGEEKTKSRIWYILLGGLVCMVPTVGLLGFAYLRRKKGGDIED